MWNKLLQNNLSSAICWLLFEQILWNVFFKCILFHFNGYYHHWFFRSQIERKKKYRKIMKQRSLISSTRWDFFLLSHGIMLWMFELKICNNNVGCFIIISKYKNCKMFGFPTRYLFYFKGVIHNNNCILKNRCDDCIINRMNFIAIISLCKV